jgi:hypothetical protein
VSELSPRPPEPSRDPNIRIGNPERDLVVERLTAALNEGRLELVEYDDRVRQVYAAKTAGELVPITADLPAPVPPPPPKPKRSLRTVLTLDELRWAGVSVLLLAIWLISMVASGKTIHPWPVWPIGIWGAVLLGRRFTGGSGHGH